MTLEKAIKILEVNVPFTRSPEASQIKEAIEIVKFALGQKNIEIHLEEAFLKECEYEIEKAKEQAVRAFAEKLKTYLLLTCPGHMSVVSYEDIDNLVNRMYTEGLPFIDNLVKEFDKDINVRTNPEQVKGE